MIISYQFLVFIKKLMQSLEEAHALLDRHVQSINKHCELEEVAHLELDETKTECRTLKKCLDNELHIKLNLEETLQARETEWNDQVSCIKINYKLEKQNGMIRYRALRLISHFEF